MSPFLIPKPPGYMGMHDLKKVLKMSDTHFDKWKKDTKDLAVKYLALDRPFTRQDPTSFAKVIRKACKAYPQLKRYKDYWPLRVYVIFYLSRASTRKCVRINLQHQYISSDSRDTSPEIPMLSTLECDIVAKEEGSGDEDIRSRTFATPAPALHVPSCSEVCVQDKSNLRPAPVLPRAASEHSYSLEAALHDMNPKLINIADRLRTKGISEGTDLVEVLGWPEITQNYFLRTEVGISPFQWMMWKVCFEKRK